MPSVRPSICLGAALLLAACKPAAERYSQSVTVDLPPAVPVESINLADADASEAPLPTPRIEPLQAPAAPAPRKPPEEPRLVMASAATPAVEPPADDADPARAPSEPAAAGARPGLSDALIARTLGRIGFPCGRVVATSRVEDGWRIDCSSGATYRGSDRSGRMRFSRW